MCVSVSDVEFVTAQICLCTQINCIFVFPRVCVSASDIELITLVFMWTNNNNNNNNNKLYFYLWTSSCYCANKLYFLYTLVCACVWVTLNLWHSHVYKLYFYLSFLHASVCLCEWHRTCERAHVQVCNYRPQNRFILTVEQPAPRCSTEQVSAPLALQMVPCCTAPNRLSSSAPDALGPPEHSPLWNLPAFSLYIHTAFRQDSLVWKNDWSS